MHPTASPLYTRTVTAAGAVTRRRCATMAGSQADTLGEKVLGIFRYDAADGAAVAVDVLGSVLAEAGGAIAVDDDLTTDAQGRVVTVTDPVTQRTLGRAVTAASGAGAAVEVLLLPR